MGLCRWANGTGPTDDGRQGKWGISVKKILLLSVATLASGSVFAAGPDLTTLSGAVDFTTVVTAILAVGVAAVSAILAWKGVKMVYAAIKGG
jgi:hypothetical protein